MTIYRGIGVCRANLIVERFIPGPSLSSQHGSQRARGGPEWTNLTTNRIPTTTNICIWMLMKRAERSGTQWEIGKLLLVYWSCRSLDPSIAMCIRTATRARCDASIPNVLRAQITRSGETMGVQEGVNQSIMKTWFTNLTPYSSSIHFSYAFGTPWHRPTNTITRGWIFFSNNFFASPKNLKGQTLKPSSSLTNQPKPPKSADATRQRWSIISNHSPRPTMARLHEITPFRNS